MVEELVRTIGMENLWAIGKGYLQLAQRSGQYKYINGDVVLEGELKSANKLTGEIDLTGEAKSDKVVGYFAYIELLNGFTKCLYMTKDAVQKWGARYSKTYSGDNSPWKTNFDEMAIKTCFRRLISKYGIMSIDMQNGFLNDNDGDESEPAQQANTNTIDLPVESYSVDASATSAEEDPFSVKADIPDILK